MGLFDFVKSVGKKLGIGDDEAPDAGKLKEELDSYDLGTEKVEVDVDGDKVIMKGEVADQSVFEKAVIALGNTLGVSKVDTGDVKVASADGGKEPVFVTVEKGDNLWSIAERVYGKGKGPHYKAIFEANKPMLKDPDLIYPGQVLRIPDIEAKA